VTLPIILCMIVRDEADTIAGVLEAARPYVDGFAIVDTGSVDGTVEECRRAIVGRPAYIALRGWPGRFDYARAWAWGWAQEVDGAGDDHLRLELSGDSYLSGTLNRDVLTPEVDGLTVRSYMGPITWRRPKITRSGRGWKYQGRLHEIAVMEGRAPVLADSGLVIHHRGRGEGAKEQGGRSEYVAMMMADLEERPDDPRTVFYAAQTLDVAGRWGEARALYEQRIRMGGWEQERYIAALRVARRAAEDGWPVEDVVPLIERVIGICEARPEGWEMLDCHITAKAKRENPRDDWLFYEPTPRG